MSIRDEFLELIRKGRNRSDEIHRKGLKAMHALGIMNASLIFRHANARLPADLRVPEEEIQELKGLMKDANHIDE